MCVYDDTRYSVLSIEITNVTKYLADANDTFEGCFNDTDPPAKPSAAGKLPLTIRGTVVKAINYFDEHSLTSQKPLTRQHPTSINFILQTGPLWYSWQL